MYKPLLLCLLHLIITGALAQKVPSSCSAPDSIRALYLDDADRMTVRHARNNQLAWEDSITIDPVLSDTLLDAMVAVYNATGLPARDTVVEMLNIHDFPEFDLRKFEIWGDSSDTWVKKLRADDYVTGHPLIDSLINRFSLTKYNQNWYQASADREGVFLQAAENQNTYALSHCLDTMKDVYYSFPVRYYGDGNTIRAYARSEFIEVIYSFGWADCSISCWYRRFWEFRVYPDCSVRYMGSYGDNVVNALGKDESSLEKPSIKIFPNPADGQLNISGEGIKNINIYTITGKKLLHKDLGRGLPDVNIDISHFQKGIYIVEINGHYRQRFVKN